MADNPLRPLSETTKRVRAKRHSVSAHELKRRYEAGEDITGQRALMRMGASNTAVLIGAEDLSEWDDEELARGQRRDQNGRFQGAAPKIVPKALHDEIVKRTLSKANELFRDNTVKAVEALVKIATNEQSEDKDRLKAIEMVLSRTLGKPVDRVAVSNDPKKWEIALEASIVSVGGYDIDEEDLDEYDAGE